MTIASVFLVSLLLMAVIAAPFITLRMRASKPGWSATHRRRRPYSAYCGRQDGFGCRSGDGQGGTYTLLSVVFAG